MNKKMITKVLVILLTVTGNCRAGCCAKSLESQCRETVKNNPVDTILKRLNQKTLELKSYQCKIKYKFSQPLFESRTMRKGVLYYARYGKKSALRINFETLKQDDEKEQKYVEQYIFDGIWLTQIDYQIKAVKRYQLADPNTLKDANEPMDAFDLVSRNFPIVGFSNVDDLKKEFEINLVKQKVKENQSVIPAKAGIQQFIHLHLKVKPDSIYKDDYTTIDFWIDKKSGLPAKIVAVSTEDDIYQIKLLKPQVNKKLDKKVFEVRIPKGFTVEETPFKKNGK